MQAVLRDIRYGARSLAKSRTLTIVAVVALSLGIGLTTTMFSIVYGALLRGMPFPTSDRLAVVARKDPTRNEDGFLNTPLRDYADFRGEQRSFTGLAAFYGGTANVTGSEKAERFEGAWTTHELFDVLGVRPVYGRGFTPADEAYGAANVAVISYSMWRDQFGLDRQVIGKAIRMNGVPHSIIGVMAEGFSFPNRQSIWLPIQVDPNLERGRAPWVRMVGLLRPGVSFDQANVDMVTIARRLAAEYKTTNDGFTATVRPIMESQIGGKPRQLLWVMLGAVFFVLLIACANVANLLLDRAAHRTKEVGIRTALGASRLAVVRQFLSEALVLAGLGALLGAVIAQAGVTLFNAAIADTDPPFWLDIRLHPPVLLFTMGMAVVATLISGAIPAYQSSRADINEILKDESRGASSFKIGRLSRALVVFEIALSCGLLVASGLMVKSVVKLGTMDPGVTSAEVFTARVGFPSTYTDTVAQKRFFSDLEQQLGALPGVQGVALSTGVPGVCCGGDQFALEGTAYATDRDYPRIGSMTVTPGFFRTYEVAPVEGRVFTLEDREVSVPVAVVNESFIKKYTPSGSPLGRRVRLGDSRSTAPWRTIVGVVPDIFTGDTGRPWDAAVYIPLSQSRSTFLTIGVRAPNAMAMTAQIRGVAAALERDIPIYQVTSLDEAIKKNVWHIRVFGGLFMVFGVAAFILAAVGLYAVMAFSVSRRAREVGIRIALGARAAHVLRLVFGQGLVQLAIGMTLGLGFGALVSQLLSAVLFDVQPRDPAVFVSVVAALTAAGLLACYVPARRAARVDPLTAMRVD